MGYPIACQACVDAGTGAQFVHGLLSLRTRPVRGTNPLIMLIGQDPTLSSGLAQTALCMGKDEEHPLRDWIVSQILKPNLIPQKFIYATNAVKCTFPGNRTPSHIAHDAGRDPFEVLWPFFSNCKKHLVSEIEMIRPKIIVSFGQATHQLLVESFRWRAPLLLAKAFGQKFPAECGELQFTYIPCIHFKTWAACVANATPLQPVYRDLWPAFMDTLKAEVSTQRIPITQMAWENMAG